MTMIVFIVCGVGVVAGLVGTTGLLLLRMKTAPLHVETLRITRVEPRESDRCWSCDVRTAADDLGLCPVCKHGLVPER